MEAEQVWQAVLDEVRRHSASFHSWAAPLYAFLEPVKAVGWGDGYLHLHYPEDKVFMFERIRTSTGAKYVIAVVFNRVTGLPVLGVRLSLGVH